ncbi:class Ib ribonucleoside-diphosphate reductase assembly flavoprotein NrdI [Corynebacterium bovis]|uniref:class Ib ribonucleoside-diphosphate reductase assembly flavoprotein NrdI n=1 Tax=Corynebacterium bovis TaxID=36808 RepID=UPI00244C5AC8|nr:class Ib ribonucleoside-diphosphate reductase assembly flavoprotein NrdI [Corynebacterium bovis]MDH2456195.1 class Ib ribonucleoside-diphosphate reductase assembly flavoprotein NrdI [Corynebacterium bovis]
MHVVYFSSTTNNTARFVAKLGLPSSRIPLLRTEDPLTVDRPYVLVCPTYGGGASVSGDLSRPVPKQVIRFLNDEGNRRLLRGVIASGNVNFGADFGKAGEVIAAKCGVPYLYRFELLGTPTDVERVREGLREFEDALRAEGRWTTAAA